MKEKLVIVSLGDVGCVVDGHVFFSNFWLSIKIIFSKALLMLLIINHHLCHYFDQTDQRTKGPRMHLMTGKMFL
jgi:hypothetical protein